MNQTKPVLDDENIISFTCVVSLAIVVLSIIGSVYFSAKNNRDMFERLVKSGQDPVRVVCARDVQGQVAGSGACFALLAERVRHDGK